MAKHPGRLRANLAPEALAELEEFESRVVWEPLLRYEGVDELNQGDADDHAPVEAGPSLMDREALDHFIVEHSYQWSGGIRFRVQHQGHEIDFVLNALQAERLKVALDRWVHGLVQDWISNDKPIH